MDNAIASPSISDPKAPGVSDKHRDEAFKASVSASYRVWADAARARVGYRETPWFPKAFEWLVEALRAGRAPSIQVRFRWSTGTKEGDGAVEYAPGHHPDVTQRFVEGQIHRLVAREIAEALDAGRFLRVRPERPGSPEKLG